MMRPSLVMLLSWIAACATPKVDDCTAQLAPDMRAYVCLAGLSTPPDDRDAQDSCFVPACGAITRDSPEAYLDLLEGASEASSMTTLVLRGADAATTDAFLVALDDEDLIVQRDAIEGVAHAAYNDEAAARLARHAPKLAAMVANDKAQSPDELDRSLKGLGLLDGRQALLTALAVAFDSAFTVETRERAAYYLTSDGARPSTSLETADYAAQRAIFEASTTPEGRAGLPPNEPGPLTLEQAQVRNDRVLMLMARARPLKTGDTMTLVLLFQNAGEVRVTVPVDNKRRDDPTMGPTAFDAESADRDSGAEAPLSGAVLGADG